MDGGRGCCLQVWDVLKVGYSSFFELHVSIDAPMFSSLWRAYDALGLCLSRTSQPDYKRLVIFPPLQKVGNALSNEVLFISRAGAPVFGLSAFTYTHSLCQPAKAVHKHHIRISIIRHHLQSRPDIRLCGSASAVQKVGWLQISSAAHAQEYMAGAHPPARGSQRVHCAHRYPRAIPVRRNVALALGAFMVKECTGFGLRFERVLGGCIGDEGEVGLAVEGKVVCCNADVGPKYQSYIQSYPRAHSQDCIAIPDACTCFESQQVMSLPQLIQCANGL